MRFVFAFFLTAVFLAGCESEEHRAIADLEGGVRVTLAARGLFGLHSDWHRTLIVEHNGRAVSRELAGDTGWWRGSNLYLAEAGLFVLDEGQNGCIAFRLAPVRFDDAAAQCRKRRATLTEGDRAGETDTDQSYIYPSMRYVGRFDEVLGDRARIVFLPTDGTPEIRLPDPL
ncbi:hypothetical protein [uncultured Pelagimonas sp.]|uniref:hypothetical protein n=1 Tax=uncultured Pelagimonas sp. TaxID=1618102 RepID=UPI0026145350|nr:hypothetical protein [uncultured Pelagimonas sp.]